MHVFYDETVDMETVIQKLKEILRLKEVDEKGNPISYKIDVDHNTGVISLNYNGRIAEIGRKGVTLLMGESTNVERPGYTMSDRSVGEKLEKIFIEERIYKDKKFEQAENMDAACEHIDDRLTPFYPQFVREVTKEDILRLMEIKMAGRRKHSPNQRRNRGN